MALSASAAVRGEPRLKLIKYATGIHNAYLINIMPLTRAATEDEARMPGIYSVIPVTKMRPVCGDDTIGLSNVVLVDRLVEGATPFAN